MASRWYPQTLTRRIAAISAMPHRLATEQGDGMDEIRRRRRCRRTVFFIDPPYTAAAKRARRRLYDHCEVDHNLLFGRAAGLAGVVAITYDKSDEVCQMAGATAFAWPRLMKNGHTAAPQRADHNELVSAWMTSPPLATPSGSGLGGRQAT